MPPVSKTVFVCQQCAYKSPKWIGKCPSCGAWNSFSEEIVLKKTDPHQHSGNITDSELIDLADVNPLDCERIILPFVEFNR
ncbi:MAG TPA: DNA repair protein RadA, partial [Prolixibacteraceae bacterium]|nr:DNA repair protein RadA [Prolixibacteraceae bacterium]